ncbi:putative FBD-associated F-box protein At3g50710 [Quercus robur]|uniref:putative FBD-associated F-box protein At3g50710 n=1 Tax=Quercus robur TaxID=38942 RepID=UPI0021621E88|nr:putative FBD-associated F-box protein At3g50710 [Quercus robur]
MFAHIVSSVLAQQECGELQTFRLQWKFGWDGSHLDTWLHTAAARKVKELDLDIFMHDCDVENLKLPPSFFSCRTLVVSKLSDLSFTTDLFEVAYKLCVPTLKRLSFSENVYNLCNYKLKINTPALEYFNFEGDLRDIKFHEKLDNLVQANVESYVYDIHKEFYREWVFRLFTALNNVKFLSFSPYGTEWHNVGNIYPSSFQNLVQLDFNVTDCNWPMLQDLLQNAPNLETLVVTKEPQYDRDYLSSHLTSFYYGGFEGLKDEEEFVKYILKEARVLKTATIQVYRGKSKENVLEKLAQ